MTNISIAFISVFLCILTACGTVDPPDIPPEQGKDYYPLQEMQLIYQVDTVTFDLNGTMRVQDTSRGFLRHRIKQIDSNWVIEQSYRKQGDSEWQAEYFISIIQQGKEIIENSNGAPLRKIIWPIEEGSSWEETALVSSDHTITIEGEPVQPFSAPWNATVVSIGDQYQLDSFSFEEVLQKQMIMEDLLIEYRDVSEIYAKDIGLVYRYSSILDTQCEHKNNDISNCIDDAWEDKANRGFIAEMKLISWQ